MKIQAKFAALLLSAAVGVCAVCAASQDQPPNQAPRRKAAQQQDRGERAFKANCSRCHKPPEQLSPRIAGTVIRHMRVRASLSADDEQAILKYLGL